MTPFIQVATTTPTRELAAEIARDLVDRRLAACAHITGPLTSVYRWEGQVEETEEWLCTLKTRATRFDDVATAIRSHHPYLCPQLIALPLVDASPDYLAWLADVVSAD